MYVYATYIDTNQDCWLNTDYIVDVFKSTSHTDDAPKYVAYTLDNERGGYLISNHDVMNLLTMDREEQA